LDEPGSKIFRTGWIHDTRSARLAMMELAGDILVVVGPAAVADYLIGDPWI
jgi:hypothetical protein